MMTKLHSAQSYLRTSSRTQRSGDAGSGSPRASSQSSSSLIPGRTAFARDDALLFQPGLPANSGQVRGIHQLKELTGNLREVGNHMRGVANVGEKPQAVHAQVRVVSVH